MILQNFIYLYKQIKTLPNNFYENLKQSYTPIKKGVSQQILIQQAFQPTGT